MTDASIPTAETIPIISRRPVRFSHEFECDTCGYNVFSAVHYGPIRTCLQCQFKSEHGIPIEPFISTEAE